MAFVGGLLSAAVRMATPILFAAIGENLTERSGVINMGMEGIMVLGAFCSFFTAYTSGNLWLGLLAAAIVGGIIALLEAFMFVSLKITNQSAAGICITILGLGLATYLNRVSFGAPLITPTLEQSFEVIKIPLLSDIPILGPVLFQNYALTYIIMALTIGLHFFFSRTSWGLRIKAMGNNPSSCDTAGVNVYVYRYVCIVLGGVLAALGGAFLTLAVSNMFMPGISAGRGWMAIVVVIFGNWSFLGILGGSLLFGAVDAFQLRLQTMGVGIPYQVMLMLPYLVTIIALVLIRKRRKPPASLGEPYQRE